MAKKKAQPTEKPAKKPSAATAGMNERLSEKEPTEAYRPSSVEKKVRTYAKRRAAEMQDFRRNLGIEKRWTEADEEYVPHELDFGTTRKRFETDQDTGLRSRMVPVGDSSQQWRQSSSAPTLLAKIQTAISIIIDQQPEANLTPLLKRYQASTALAYSLWKRNWSVTDAKEKLKLVIFNLIKYGWAPQRTYPRTVKYPKRVLESKDTENPENDKYSDKEITWFNDVDRQPLDPFRTWIDELSKPYDPYSTNECYFELEFSYDAAEVEFGLYPNWKFVKRDSQASTVEVGRKSDRARQASEMKTRKDIVTIGFFESRHKDIFEISVPKDNITLYLSPLPNDDGYLSITHTLWLLRSTNIPYGISLWEVIRQNKALYDKMKNMTMDQLVLSIMKFGFFSGTNAAVGDGKMEIVPGQARQLTSSSGKPEISWMDIPGPGQEAWKGMEMIANMMDDESGISPTMEGEVTGKTLGEILHAKEAALKRMKVPVENIGWLIEQDAYLTLSWMSQVYAIPTIMQFADMQELMAFEKEQQMEHMDGGLFGTAVHNEDGSTGVTAPYEAHFLPQLALHLEDRNGELTPGKESKFFQVGKDIQPSQLKWRGIFKVIPRSIVDSSQQLVKATKMEMFNVLAPLFQFPPQLVARAAEQIVKVNEEDPKDWLPEDWITYLENPTPQAQPAMPGMAPGGPQGADQSLFVPAGGQAAPAQPGLAQGAQPQSLQAGAGMTAPQAQTVVPKAQISGGPTIANLAGGAGRSAFGGRL